MRKLYWFAGITVGTLVLLVFLLSLVDIPEQETLAESGDHRIDAYIICHRFIEKDLIAPSTVDYPFESYKAVTSPLDGESYRVASYFDAENRFGAKIRTSYDCVVKLLPDERWELISLDLDGR